MVPNVNATMTAAPCVDATAPCPDFSNVREATVSSLAAW
jgi:hypothetical protein